MDGEKRYVTLEDLCGEDMARDIKEKELKKFGEGVFIRYRARIPLDLLLRLQRRYHIGEKGSDQEGYYCALLQFLLLNPSVNVQQAKLLLKGDAAVLMQIIGEATGAVASEEEQKEVTDEVGESLASGQAEEQPTL